MKKFNQYENKVGYLRSRWQVNERYGSRCSKQNEDSGANIPVLIFAKLLWEENNEAKEAHGRDHYQEKITNPVQFIASEWVIDWWVWASEDQYIDSSIVKSLQHTMPI